jgi:nicotinamide phosphoribosyltransferase
MREFPCPETVRVDAYQAAHFTMIPPGMEGFECSQGIFRRPVLSPSADGHPDLRLISAGLAPFIKLNLQKPITAGDLTEADDFWADYHAEILPPYHKPYPWPRDMFRRIVERYEGRYPIVITGLFDGQAHYVGEPHVQVWTDEPGMGECVGWIESTLLPYLWTSSTVATHGRMRLEKMLGVYRDCYPSRSEDELRTMVRFKFHDFGRRGGAASQITGIAHLVNWLGTDTCDAAYAATKFLNGGRKFGACSIVAAAHRTITPWPAEIDAYRQVVDKYRHGLMSVVSDSYNYTRGMEMLAGFADVVKIAGGCLIGRPDSGDPVQCILEGLEIFSRAFGFTLQEKGLRVLENSAIIQGDGVSDDMIFGEIYPAVIAAGFCPSNVAFGMGEHNHKALRSETEHAYKTCLVGAPRLASEHRLAPQRSSDTSSQRVAEEQCYRAVMKSSESLFKRSLPCAVSLDFSRAAAGDFSDRVRRASVSQLKHGATGDLVVLYDGRPNPLPVQTELFEDTRERAYWSWKALVPDPGDTFDPEIRRMQEAHMARVGASSAS